MLVIISGNNATGKTTLGRQLARRLGYEFCSKDLFKEALFATHRRNKLLFWHWYDHRAKHELFNRIVRAQADGEAIVVESNFEPRDRRRLRAIIRSDDAAELFFYARPGTVFRRYLRRLMTGEKAAGHYDWFWVPVASFFFLLSRLGYEYFTPTGATGSVLRVDTDDFSKVSLETLLRFVRTAESKRGDAHSGASQERQARKTPRP